MEGRAAQRKYEVIYLIFNFNFFAVKVQEEIYHTYHTC